MQRDGYAALIKLPNTRKVPARITQLTGQVFTENLMRSTFTGYQRRRLALMTHTAGQDPLLPRLPRDIILPTFDAFLRTHQPHFMYKLLPLQTTTIDAFAALQSVCSCAGSPFLIEDRIDSQVMNFHLSLLCAHRDKLCEILKSDTAPSELHVPPATRQLPIASVVFDGILCREHLDMPPGSLPGAEAGLSVSGLPTAAHAATAAAASPASSSSSPPSLSRAEVKPARPRKVTGAVFLTMNDVCNEATLRQRVLMKRLVQDPIFPLCIGSTNLSALLLSAEYQLHVMAVRRRVGVGVVSTSEHRLRARLVEQARAEGIVLFEQTQPFEFQYVQ